MHGFQFIQTFWSVFDERVFCFDERLSCGYETSMILLKVMITYNKWMLNRVTFENDMF